MRGSMFLLCECKYIVYSLLYGIVNITRVYIVVMCARVCTDFFAQRNVRARAELFNVIFVPRVRFNEKFRLNSPSLSLFPDLYLTCLGRYAAREYAASTHTAECARAGRKKNKISEVRAHYT